MAKREQGLRLVKIRGSDNWYVRGTYLKVRIYRSTGTHRQEVARRIRRQWEKDIEGGGVRSKPGATFARAVKLYATACPAGELKAVYRLQQYFGDRPLDEIDLDVIDRCVRYFYPKGPTAEPSAINATINRHVLTQLSAILRLAAQRKLCHRLDIPRYKEKKGRVRYATPDEARKILEACEVVCPITARFVAFLFATGARTGDALGLDWLDVDLAKRHAVFRDTKNGETYGVSLNSSAIAALADLSSRSGLCFPFTYDTVQKRFDKAMRQAGIENFSLHCCRHTFATWARQAGHDWKKIMDAGRWKSASSMLRYSHVSSVETRDLVDSLPSLKRGKSVKSAKPHAKLKASQ